MRRDKRYATRSVQPAQPGPSAKVSCSSSPEARSVPGQPERWNRSPLLNSKQHGIIDESLGTDQSDDSFKPTRSKTRRDPSTNNVNRPRQSVRLRKFDNGKKGDPKDITLVTPDQSCPDCVCNGPGKWKQPIDFQPGSVIKTENPEETTHTDFENHICPKAALISTAGPDYLKRNTSSRQIKVKNEVLQDHPCQGGSNGYISNSTDPQVSGRMLSGTFSAITETMCGNYSVRNVRCQEKETLSQTRSADRSSVCKRIRPLSHVNQSKESKWREKVDLPPSMPHDVGSGQQCEQAENCIVVKTEIPSDQHFTCERSPSRQNPMPLRNHSSSYKFHSLRNDKFSLGTNSCDHLSSGLRSDQGKQGVCCNQPRSLRNNLTPDENFRESVTCNDCPDNYILENRKSRTFQKISRNFVNSMYKENSVIKSPQTEEICQSQPPLSPSLPTTTTTTETTFPHSSPPSPSSLPSQNNKLFSSETSRFSPETACVKPSLQYEQSSVINPLFLESPPRTIQEKQYWSLDSIPLKKEPEDEAAGRNFSHQCPDQDEGQSPPVFKNVSEALHQLHESPKVPLVCMKDVIVIDSSGSETSTCSYQSITPEQDLTAKSPQSSRRVHTSRSKVAQRLNFVHEKESTNSDSQDETLNDNPEFLDKNLVSDPKKNTSNKTDSSQTISNSVASRGTEKAFPANNSDLILSRTDRIRSPSIRYRDDVLFFPLVFPSRSSQSATNRVSEAIEKISNNRQQQADLEQKCDKKKEDVKVFENAEKIICKSKRNMERASSDDSPNISESLDQKRVLRRSSLRSETLSTTKDATSHESLPLLPIPVKKEQTCVSDGKTLSSGCRSPRFSSDSPILPPKSNKVLRSQSSSLKALSTLFPPPTPPPPPPPPLSATPSPSASSSHPTTNPEPKCSSGDKIPSANKTNGTKVPKTKTKPNDNKTDSCQPKLSNSPAKATITDVTCKSSTKGDEPLAKNTVSKPTSKWQSSLRSYSSTSAVIKEPAPLSILSRPEREVTQNKKLNAFVSDELDKYLAQEISNYAISPQKINKSTQESARKCSKMVDPEDKKKVLPKMPSLSPKRIFCDKRLVMEQSESSNSENTITAVAYNTRRHSSLNNGISLKKEDNQATDSLGSVCTTQIIPKKEPDAAAASNFSEKLKDKTDMMPIPTSASSDSDNRRQLRPRPEQLAARLNKPCSSYSSSSNLSINNSQPYEPDFDEVDGILFMSFPNVESLQAHIAVERKSNWGSAPSHMSSISKVLNFNRWKERHKAMKLPRPVFEKNKNLRGLHMRMKLYYKLLRSEWHRIKQRNQYRSRYGFKKTNDFSKIKSWQAKLRKNEEIKKSSQKVSAQSQEVAVDNSKPDEIQQIRVKRRKKNFILTHRKYAGRTNISRQKRLENISKSLKILDESVNNKNKESSPSIHTVATSIEEPTSATNSSGECPNVLKSAHLLYQTDEINQIKKLGGCDPSDHAMRKRTRSQVELENFHRRRKNLPPIALDWLTHNMVQVAMTALHEDFVKKKATTSAGKNASNVDSEDKHNTDTFIQVDSQEVSKVQKTEETLPSLFEHEKSPPLPSSTASGSAVQLCKTSDEELAKDTARILLDRQKLKAKDDKCNKPGCRYGCICHLCWISENLEDSSKTSAINTKTCDKEYCRLGCICDSNDNIKLESVCDERTCTLERCQCTERKSVAPMPSKNKECLKRAPQTALDGVSVSQEKVATDKEPEFSQEKIKFMAADVADSLLPETNECDVDKERNKKSDICMEEKLKCQRRDRPTTLLPKRECAHRDAKNVDATSRKPVNTERSEIFQMKKRRKLDVDGKSAKVDSTKVNQLQTKSSSAYTENEKDNSKTDPSPSSNSIKRLCPLSNNLDQPLEQCYGNCGWFPADAFDDCVVEIDRLGGSPQQMRELGCMSVDCFPQSPKVCSTQQVENGRSTTPSTPNSNSSSHMDCIKFQLIDLSPIKVKLSAETVSPPVSKVTNTSRRRKSDAIRLLGDVSDPEKWMCPLVDLTEMSTEEESCVDKDWQVKMICVRAKQDISQFAHKNMEDGYQLLEFISNCDWDSHSSDIIFQVSLCCRHGRYPNPQKMVVANFDVEILPKSDKAPYIPPQFQSEIFCCPYNIRVKVTDRTKSSTCEETVQSLDGYSYVGFSSIGPLRNNDQFDIKNMPLTATLQDINYPSQEDHEQPEMTGEAKNVVGDIEVLEFHPPLDDAKMPPSSLVLDLSSPGNQKSLQQDHIQLVTDLPPVHDVPAEKWTKPGMQAPTNGGEENRLKPSEELAPPLSAAVDLSFTTSEETKITADAPSNIRLSRQCSSKDKVVHDWSLRSKLTKSIKQEFPAEESVPFKNRPTKSAKNCDSHYEKTKSRNCDPPQRPSNDSSDMCPNCSSAESLKRFDDNCSNLKSPTENTPLMQSFRKILPTPGRFFVASSQPGVNPFCLGHLQGCSLLRTDLNNFTDNHAACSAYSNACRLGRAPANQLLQLVPVAVPVPVPVPVTFPMKPDGSPLNTNVTIPIIYSKSRTSTCSVSPGSSMSSCLPSLKTETTCCSPCGSTLSRSCPNQKSTCIAATNSIKDCDMKSSNTAPTNGPPPPPLSLPQTVSQPNQNPMFQSQNSLMPDSCNVFMRNIDGCQEHSTNKCVFRQTSLSSASSPEKCDVNLNGSNIVSNTNNELVNCQATPKSVRSSVATASKDGVPFWRQQQPTLQQTNDCICDIVSKNSIQEKVKKLCAKNTRMNETPATTDGEPVNCSSFKSGLNVDARPDTSEDELEDDYNRTNNSDQSARDRRNQLQLTAHKTRERERRCTIFNGLHFLQKVLFKDEYIQLLPQRKILDFAVDHIKSLHISQEELSTEKELLVQINHQLWEQLKRVKEELKFQNVMESEQNKMLDECGLPFDMYMPPEKGSIKLEDDTGSPLKLLPPLDSCESSDVEWKDHSDIEFEMDVRLVSSSLPPRSPSPSPASGPLNEVHSSNEDTILMSPVTSRNIHDLDDDDFEAAESKESLFCLTSGGFD